MEERDSRTEVQIPTQADTWIGDSAVPAQTLSLSQAEPRPPVSFDDGCSATEKWLWPRECAGAEEAQVCVNKGAPEARPLLHSREKKH